MNGLCRATCRIPKLATILVPDSVPASRCGAEEGGCRDTQVLQRHHVFRFSYLSPNKYCVSVESELQAGGACVVHRVVAVYRVRVYGGRTGGTETQQWSLLAVLAVVK